MNRSELVEKVADVTGLEKDRAEKAVMAFIDTVKDAIKAEGKVSIFGFGTFNPTARAARQGRNPQTGAPVKIAASKGVRFSPAAAFKLALNSRPAKKGAAKSATAAKKVVPAKKAGSTPATKTVPSKSAAAATTAATTKKAPAAKSGSTKKAATTKKAPAAKSGSTKKAATAASTKKSAPPTTSAATKKSAAAKAPAVKKAAAAKKTGKSAKK